MQHETGRHLTPVNSCAAAVDVLAGLLGSVRQGLYY